MSYRLGKRRRNETPQQASSRLLPTSQSIQAMRAMAVGSTRKHRSTRSARKKALRKAAELRVKIERSVIKSNGLVGKRIDARRWRELFKHIPEAYELAYKKQPDLFKWRLNL